MENNGQTLREIIDDEVEKNGGEGNPDPNIEGLMALPCLTCQIVKTILLQFFCL